MAYFIDSHCHLHDKEFFSEEEAEEALQKAFDSGVQKIVCIGTDEKDSLAARDFANSHENVFWTYGIHPENAGQKWEFNQNLKPCAIGEVGLDYHYEPYDRDAQIKLFNEMLQLASDHNLPVSFHIRNAFDDFFPIVNNFPHIRGVVHSFTDSKKNLKKILETTDFYVGVNGLATYSTLPTPPLNRILLETDAPFLAPIPHRGEKNEPAYIPDVATWLADKLSTDVNTVAEQTAKNTETLYKI